MTGPAHEAQLQSGYQMVPDGTRDCVLIGLACGNLFNIYPHSLACKYSFHCKLVTSISMIWPPQPIKQSGFQIRLYQGDLDSSLGLS